MKVLLFIFVITTTVIVDLASARNDRYFFWKTNQCCNVKNKDVITDFMEETVKTVDQCYKQFGNLQIEMSPKNI